MRNILVKTLSLIMLLVLCACIKNEPSVLKNGDIVFQTSNSAQSKAIQLATKSRYSHMGIIYINNGKHYVFEAVQPIKLTELETWIKRGQSGHYVVKRVKSAESLLTPEALVKMKKAAEQFSGKNYDPFFEWSDDRIYCSELVWKIYKQALNIELCSLKQFKEFDFSHPVVITKLNERYGGKMPLKEPVIAPSQLFNSSLLRTVYVK